jgi:hypothetical protein
MWEELMTKRNLVFPIAVLFSFGLFLLSLITIHPVSAQSSQAPVKLFTQEFSQDPFLKDTAKGQSHLGMIKAQKTTKEARVVKANPEALNSEKIEINIPDGNTVIANKISSQEVEGGYKIWQGKTEGDMGDVILVGKDGRVRGSVQTVKFAYEIENLPDYPEYTAIELLDRSKFSKIDDEQKILERQEKNKDKEKDKDKASDTSSSPQTSASTFATTADSGSVIRVLVVYTPRAVNRVGDIGSLIWQAAAQTNQSYANSGINPRIQIADFMYVNYTETGSIDTDTARLAGTNDGFMDSVHSVRDSSGADVVVLLTDGNTGDYAWHDNGYGQQVRVEGNADAIMANASTAFVVVQAGDATADLVFAHEIGHLQGARHNSENDQATTPYAYGHGYCYQNIWRTVMAYSCPNGDGAHLPYWSNPNISYNGVPMGTATGANNAQVLNNTAYTVANFRQSPAAQNVDYNYYTYYAPQGTQATDLAGSDIWNIPAYNNVKFTAGIDIDGDKNDEVAVMRNENGDYNLYVYKSPKCSDPAAEVARDLWTIPDGNNIVAMAGGDFDGDGKKNDIAVVKNQNGDWNAFIYRVNPGATPGTLIATDLWNIPEKNSVVSMAGVDIDGDGKDEVGVVRNEGGDYNYYAYKTVMGYNPSVKVATDLWNIPEGNNVVSIAGGNFDLSNAGDEIAVMKNEGGDYNMYIYKALMGSQGAPKIGGDLWNIPAGSKVKTMNTLDFTNSSGTKSLIGVIRDEPTKPSLPACHEPI